jgi:hypothetical protein
MTRLRLGATTRQAEDRCQRTEDRRQKEDTEKKI